MKGTDEEIVEKKTNAAAPKAEANKIEAKSGSWTCES